jgi:hypothetical protein
MAVVAAVAVFLAVPHGLFLVVAVVVTSLTGLVAAAFSFATVLRRLSDGPTAPGTQGTPIVRPGERSLLQSAPMRRDVRSLWGRWSSRDA